VTETGSVHPHGGRVPLAPVPVLFFTTRLGSGGAEMHLLRLLNHFDRRLIQPRLAVARPGGNYEHLLRPDIPVHHLGGGRIRSSTLSLIRAIRPLRHLIGKVRPAVVAGILDPAVGALGRAVSGLRGADRPRLVACLQNNFSEENRRRKMAWLVQPTINRGFQNADRIIALSQGAADDMARVLPGTAGKLRVIFNAAFDETLVARSQEACPLKREPDVPQLVCCGRLAPQKGYPHLLQAIRRVLKTRPVRLWILGDGPDRAAIQAEAAALGLAEQVTFAGFQSNPFAFFRAADLFVLSSLYEGFGNVIVEAMGCGTAVLSTDCPYGPGEIITHGENGWLVPPGDPVALANGILEALSDPGRRKRVADAGAARARDFSSPAIAAAYMAELVALAQSGPCDAGAGGA
jgi:glycosyltransferase involved in cell wall biosynthesis